MIIKHLIAHSTEHCTLNGRYTMVVEASDLGLKPGFKFEQIYDDACDVGLTMKSHVTGREITFFLQEEIRSADELQGWQLKPIPELIRKHPQLAGLTLIIFND